MDDAARLRDFATSLGHELPEPAAPLLVAFTDAMLAENQHVNLTAVRDRDAALVLHAMDSLGVLLVDHDPTRTLDLGTGNGFPGIAIAATDDSADVTLLDRTQKKIAAITRALEAAHVDPTRVRAQALDAAQLPAHGGRGRFTLVTSRAVASAHDVGKLAAPLLRRHGRLVLWLSVETEAPRELPGGLRRIGVWDYALPDPAARERRIAAWER
ncbi:MAG: class I SAM-dependent methyltransferase [Planctomycetes bacterium]|nr:class I SAM-dependent methyltransferase [Planctomycetota bacterium]